MNRTAWILLVLLLGTNLAWFALGGPQVPPAAPPHQEPAAGETKTVELERQLAAAQEQIRALEARPQRVEASKPKRPPDPEREARLHAQREQQARAARTYQKAKGWFEAALQTTDLAARAAALQDIRTALASGDPETVQAGLQALAQLYELDFDRASFRSLVLPQVRSPDGLVRAAALRALPLTGIQEGDVGLLLALVADESPEVRGGLTHVLSTYSKGRIEGAVADAVVRLLDDPSEQVRRNAVTSLWGARVDPRIEDRYLAMLEVPATRHDAIYFGLSTFAEKSPRVVAALIDALDDPASEDSHRARWGLQHGVPAESASAVAEAALRLLETRNDLTVQRDCLRLLRTYGRAGLVHSLETFAARPGVSDALREEVHEVVTVLRKR